MADLFDPLATLTNDRASQLLVGYREENERGAEGKQNKQAEKHFRHWEYICVELKMCETQRGDGDTKA